MNAEEAILIETLERTVFISLIKGMNHEILAYVWTLNVVEMKD